MLRLESDLEGVVELVLGHGREGDVLGIGEVWSGRTINVSKKLGDFSDTVGPVVEEKDLISLLDTSLLSSKNDGLQKLVVFSLLVSLFNGLDRVGAFLTISNTEGVQANLDSVPSLVTVHSVVPTDDGSNLANANFLDLLQQLLHVTSTGFGVGVASVTEEVNVYVGDFEFLGDLEKGVEVILLGMLQDVSSAQGEVRQSNIPHHRQR